MIFKDRVPQQGKEGRRKIKRLDNDNTVAEEYDAIIEYCDGAEEEGTALNAATLQGIQKTAEDAQTTANRIYNNMKAGTGIHINKNNETNEITIINTDCASTVSEITPPSRQSKVFLEGKAVYIDSKIIGGKSCNGYKLQLNQVVPYKTNQFKLIYAGGEMGPIEIDDSCYDGNLESVKFYYFTPAPYSIDFQDNVDSLKKFGLMVVYPNELKVNGKIISAGSDVLTYSDADRIDGFASVKYVNQKISRLSKVLDELPETVGNNDRYIEIDGISSLTDLKDVILSIRARTFAAQSPMTLHVKDSDGNLVGSAPIYTSALTGDLSEWSMNWYTIKVGGIYQVVYDGSKFVMSYTAPAGAADYGAGVVQLVNSMDSALTSPYAATPYSVKMLKNYVDENVKSFSYIDLADFYNGSTPDGEALTQKISEEVSKRRYNNRANIVFYTSNSNLYYVLRDASFCSNANYYYAYENDYGTYLNLTDLHNCSFYNFNISTVTSSLITITNCDNLSFINCQLLNGMGEAVKIVNSKQIYFENCVLKGGSYLYKVISYTDTSTDFNWAMFKDCVFNNDSSDYKVLDASATTNVNSLITLDNCFYQDLSNDFIIQKGLGKVSVIKGILI